MSFDAAYATRFKTVIEPAITAITHRGRKLRAFRVDLSKRGDSILTEIIDGIAHSEMVLADVSTVGYDAKTGQPYRNGNVMYEVGLALASRHSSEVLLIRDDKERFLFDVSTVPHLHLDFSAKEAAHTLHEELQARLKEIDHMHDARVAMAVATLTSEERAFLKQVVDAKYQLEKGRQEIFWINKASFASMVAVPRLLDKQLIRAVGVTHDEKVSYVWTPVGRALAKNLGRLTPKMTEPPEPPSTTEA